LCATRFARPAPATRSAPSSAPRRWKLSIAERLCPRPCRLPPAQSAAVLVRSRWAASHSPPPPLLSRLLYYPVASGLPRHGGAVQRFSGSSEANPREAAAVGDPSPTRVRSGAPPPAGRRTCVLARLRPPCSCSVVPPPARVPVPSPLPDNVCNDGAATSSHNSIAGRGGEGGSCLTNVRRRFAIEHSKH